MPLGRFAAAGSNRASETLLSGAAMASSATSSAFNPNSCRVSGFDFRRTTSRWCLCRSSFSTKGGLASLTTLAVLGCLFLISRPSPDPGKHDAARSSAEAPPLGVVEVLASRGATVIETRVLKDAGGSSGSDGYLALVSGAAAAFHVEGACGASARTSTTAALAKCQYAINGGPFNSYLTGGCIGPTVSHDETLSTDWNTSFASFGLTSDGHWLLGRVDASTAIARKVRELVTGFGWLVQGGKAVSQAPSKKASRSAVGVDGGGRLLLLQVDGCEWCPLSGGARGLTLGAFADLLVGLGAVHAINLDGGGSSTSVRNGLVINQPDCLEIGLRCERPVTTVLCVA